MALIRDVSVGFQGSSGKIERVEAQIPADWVSGEKDALHEIYENQRVRTRIAVTPGSALWATIGEPWDPVAAAAISFI